MTFNELKEFQAAKEEKVYRIWTVLSAFEESAAGCISDMLLNVSEGNYVECLKMADYFVTHVDVLFSAIDDLATNYYDQLENTLVYERETNMLCGKVSNFFSLLSHTQQTGYRRSGITQDLLTLVTGLAHYLKALIRIGLTGSLRLDKKKDAKTEAVSRFLSKLMELANRKKKIDNIIYSDLCQLCQKVCDDTCISTITDDSKDVFTQGVKRISKLKQSSFLLRVALQRLYNTLNITEKQPLPNLSRQKIEQKNLELPQKSQQQLLPQEPSKHQKAPSPPPPPPIPQETTSQEQPNEQINLNDIKRMKSTRMNRKVTNSHRIGKRSTLMEVPSPTTASLTNEFEEAKHHQNNNGDSSRASFNGRQQHKYTKSVPQAKSFYFSELGTLQHFMLKHIAVLYLEEILRNHFSLEELSDLIDEQKNSSLWSKFVTMDKNGIESNLGVGPTRIIKIPTFIDECVAAMKQMDMSVEGIFRKNGNIRRLKELSDDIDKNPGCIQFINETPIQIAALIKKFLRELPDPLLTFKLHRIFVTAQKLELETDRKRVIHLACCLLPKANRDTMEVLFTFMKWVAQFAEDSEGRGSKMTIENLATVIAPNILYSNSKDPIKDESMDAIETVRILLKNAEEFATVPEDFVPLLQNLSCEEGDMDLNVRHILKKITLLRG
ncbi:MAG: hypothetical protein EXX96DRAFT_477944 [Benjaminiella poitrasii]|nr:MAG: hypothetical protein EXX96DRAFT_477944 [Benjaminiella poitrasii]